MKNPAFSSAALPADEDVNARLATAVREIKREAKGRVCGGCKHMRDGWCAETLNINGEALTVFYANAVACSKHEAG